MGSILGRSVLFTDEKKITYAAVIAKIYSEKELDEQLEENEELINPVVLSVFTAKEKNPVESHFMVEYDPKGKKPNSWRNYFDS